MYSLLLSLLLTFLSVSDMHDIHVSVCDIKYNTETSSIQVSLRIFLDDLETSLKENSMDDLKILTHKESEKADSIINNYVHSHLKILTDGKSHHMDFIGKELSDDFLAMWAYFEIPNISQIQALEVSNDILMELYSDQQNVVTVKKNKNKLGHWLFDRKRHVKSVDL